MRTPLHAAPALALVLVAGAGAALAPSTRAQGLPLPGEGFDWERVGDIPVDATSLAFDSEGTLWASGSRGLYRLGFSGGFPGTWVLVNDRIGFQRVLPLSPDTLLIVGPSSTRRSTDGGLSFEQVHDDGRNGLYEVPEGHSYAGRLLVGDGGGVQASDDIAYSDDRGATFTASVVPEWGGADAFVSLPPGSAHAGRVLATGPWGVAISDDGGATFRESALWEVVRYEGHAICLVERPDGGGLRALAIGYDSTEPYLRVWTSDDEGETWADRGGLPEGPPYGPGGSGKGLFVLDGSTVLAVAGRGTIYRSDDAGQTWEAVGRAPVALDGTDFADSAALGPDGRLYVGLGALGPTDGWVYRTEVLTAAVGTAAQPVGDPVVIGPGSGSFQFTVTLTNRTALPQRFETWSEATGPLSRSPVLGPRTVTLPAGASVTRTLVQRVPANAPAGTYTYTVAVGDFPGTVISSDGFPVVKQGVPGVSVGGGAEGDADGWAVSGWEAAATVSQEEGVGLSVSPNPARGAVTVTLVLPEAGTVTVAVYDVLGRRVALLYEGTLEAGAHGFGLDGGALPVGAYVVRARVADLVRGAGSAVVTRTVTLLR
jgi:photosystem II stability/assembly factor-like uncharacterized protein